MECSLFMQSLGLFLNEHVLLNGLFYRRIRIRTGTIDIIKPTENLSQALKTLILAIV